MLAVGGHYLGELTEREKRLACGFAGGIGESYRSSCGAFSAGIIVISALFGRNTPRQDDQLCQDLVVRYRDSFLGSFETTNCGSLREERYGSGGAEPCSILVERAARILVDLIDAQQALLQG